MLKHLQKRIVDTVSQTDAVILSTRGLLGIHQFPCQFWQIHPHQTWVYSLVPKTPDMLETLTASSEAFVTASLWRACGTVQVPTPVEGMAGSNLPDHFHTRWCSLVEIQLHRIELNPYAGWQETATIDFD
jgi:hypothetical protein